MGKPILKIHLETDLKRDHFWGNAATLTGRFSAPIESILDRLDIFSDATDLKTPPALLFFLGLLSRGAVQGRSTIRHTLPGSHF